MPGLPILATSQLLCPHGGKVVITPAAPRVTTDTAPLTTIGDVFTVVGCSLVASGITPCTTVQWPSPSTRVFINNLPAVIFSPDAPGSCLGSPTPVPPVVTLPPGRVQQL